jgi:hypothetical protein
MAAPLNKISSWPCWLSIVSTIRFTCSACETSTWVKLADPPPAWISLTVSSPPGALLSAATTSAPSRANRCAVARAIPDAAPVTSATRPLSFVGNPPAVHSSFYEVKGVAIRKLRINLGKPWSRPGLRADRAAATKSLLECQRRGEPISNNLLSVNGGTGRA